MVNKLPPKKKKNKLGYGGLLGDLGKLREDLRKGNLRTKGKQKRDYRIPTFRMKNVDKLVGSKGGFYFDWDKYPQSFHGRYGLGDGTNSINIQREGLKPHLLKELGGEIKKECVECINFYDPRLILPIKGSAELPVGIKEKALIGTMKPELFLKQLDNIYSRTGSISKKITGYINKEFKKELNQAKNKWERKKIINDYFDQILGGRKIIDDNLFTNEEMLVLNCLTDKHDKQVGWEISRRGAQNITNKIIRSSSKLFLGRAFKQHGTYTDRPLLIEMKRDEMNTQPKSLDSNLNFILRRIKPRDIQRIVVSDINELKKGKDYSEGFTKLTMEVNEKLKKKGKDAIFKLLNGKPEKTGVTVDEVAETFRKMDKVDYDKAGKKEKQRLKELYQNIAYYTLITLSQQRVIHGRVGVGQGFEGYTFYKRRGK